jgi:hypothetical protein
MRLRKHALGSLEYRSTKTPRTHRRKWGFRFKSSDGSTVLQSGIKFSSLAQAERGFYDALKLMATNQYTIEYPGKRGAERN